MITVEGRDIIYLDNAATTLPKPERVVDAMAESMVRAGNPGRSGHFLSILSSRDIFRTREIIAKLLKCHDSSRVILTPSATYALNFALKGVLEEGDHVVTTVMDHNSVIRPLCSLSQKGVEVTYVEADYRGGVDPKDIIRSVKENTKMIAMVHCSNVTGEIYDVGSVYDFCASRGLYLLIDASQTAGVVDMNAGSMGLAMIAASGHKSLFGPQGTGFLYLGSDVEISPIIEGGTGSKSEEGRQPDFFPDRLEAGTLNSVGYAGLAEGVDYVFSRGIEKILQHERELISIFLEGIKPSGNIVTYGPEDLSRRIGVVLLNIKGADPADCSLALEESHGVLVRPGLHCAPLAHKTLGTFPSGGIRVSFSALNSGEDAIRAAKAFLEVGKQV